MQIENQTGTFVPLLGGVNFQADKRHPSVPVTYSFGIDWTKEGDGQEILREHIRSSSAGRVEWHGAEYQGKFEDLWGMNTAEGMVRLTVGLPKEKI